MKVSCQACGAKYTIADEKVRGRKVKIRCKSCGTPIVVDGQSSIPPPEVAAGTPAPAAAAAAAAPGAGSSWSVNLSDTDQRTMTTQEIIDGWKTGVVTNDAFVWKDGMADWVPILDSAELKSLLSTPGAAAAAASGTPFGPTIVTAPAAAGGGQARLAGGGRGGVDLFDATEGPDEDDVATSAPHLPMAGTSAYDDKMTGARNENSVLFSLDSLKGGLSGGGPSAEKKAPAPARKAPSAGGEDPFAMGGSELGGGSPLFSLNANQALLTAPAAPEPPPPRFDASGAPAKPTNKLLIYGGAAGGAVILLLVGLLIGRGGRGDEGATPEGSAKAAGSAEPEKKDAKEEPKAEEKKEEKEEPKAPASAAPAASSTESPGKVAGTSGTKPSTPSSPAGGTTTTKPSSGGTEPKKEEPSSAGTAPFSVSAAQVALTQAASNAAGCGKPGGPTGSGKATVTFATSGRVTTANVGTPPFAGTPVGGCVAGVFRKAKVPPFSGNPVTVSKSFSIK
ncbi:MAG TPA: zinc-ribbon domain-containing protein [Polyangiaceae bacterium]